jgi:ribosomal protein S6E (S10)
MKDLEKFIQKKVSEALEGSFMDAQVYGVGFIKIEIDGGDIDVQHVSFQDIEETLEKIVNQKKFLA